MQGTDKDKICLPEKCVYLAALTQTIAVESYTRKINNDFTVAEVIARISPTSFTEEVLKYIKGHLDKKSFLSVLKELRKSGINVNYDDVDPEDSFKIGQDRARAFINELEAKYN